MQLEPRAEGRAERGELRARLLNQLGRLELAVRAKVLAEDGLDARELLAHRLRLRLARLAPARQDDGGHVRGKVGGVHHRDDRLEERRVGRGRRAPAELDDGGGARTHAAGGQKLCDAEQRVEQCALACACPAAHHELRLHPARLYPLARTGGKRRPGHDARRRRVRCVGGAQWAQRAEQVHALRRVKRVGLGEPRGRLCVAQRSEQVERRREREASRQAQRRCAGWQPRGLVQPALRRAQRQQTRVRLQGVAVLRVGGGVRLLLREAGRVERALDRRDAQRERTRDGRVDDARLFEQVRDVGSRHGEETAAVDVVLNARVGDLFRQQRTEQLEADGGELGGRRGQLGAQLQPHPARAERHVARTERRAVAHGEQR
mmetsp:Transcript_36948/g.91579  ORF Transcript_36948/g.91579 Transcript_36948/m.91579 type:complete len:376 (-) Transcript_36948:609-1736(-)